MLTFIPLVGGILSGLSSKEFQKVQGQPPGWVFGPVWTVLYLMMGYASYIIQKKTGKVPFIFWIQLALNLSWSPIFTRGFKKEAFYIILALWTSILLTIVEFSKIDAFAAKLLVPYLLWVTYATRLNYVSI